MKIKNQLLLCWLIATLISPQIVSAGEWDQTQVTVLASELNRVLLKILGREGEAQPESDVIEERKLNAAVVDLERLQKEVERMVEMLVSGRDQNQTRGFQHKINALRGSIRDYTSNTVISTDIELLAGHAGKLIDEMNAYYR